jgi:hypothetical protein
VVLTPGVTIQAETYQDKVGADTMQSRWTVGPQQTTNIAGADLKCPGGDWGTNYRSLGRDFGRTFVRVTVPSLDKPLYGLLVLCGIVPSGGGPDSRAYRIQVPQDYVDATSEGRVSVVYAQYNAPEGALTSWALFLSREPFTN